MKNLKHKITLKDILKAGATQIERGSNIYEIGNQKYIIKDGIVIHSYKFNDICLEKYDFGGKK